jgi:hypothetical protein
MPRQSSCSPTQIQLADQASLAVFALLSSHVLPGCAVPFGTPKQSRQVEFGTIPVVPPAHTPHWSTDAVPFDTPAQSKLAGVPAHVQLANHSSLMVFALLSSQVLPGCAAPFGTPKQSRQVEFGTIPVVPPAHTPHWSTAAVPFATPAQSKLAGVPEHVQFADHTSLMVLPLLSSQVVPG